jgi:hydrogenase maturation protease
MTANGTKVLVAGVGNIFLSDDAFGVEVANRLGQEPMPPGVKVADFGIGGVHLAFELLEGYDAAILVDAVPRGGEPGTVCVIEPEVDGAQCEGLVDAHGLDPESVLTLLDRLGGAVGRLLIVGCEPASVEDGMGLSPPVAAAVDEAVDVVRSLVSAFKEG